MTDPEALRRIPSSDAEGSLARELYWAAPPIPPGRGEGFPDSIPDVATRWGELEASLRLDHSLPLPAGERFLEGGRGAKGWLKRRIFRLTRPVGRRYDRIGADISRLGLETASTSERTAELASASAQQLEALVGTLGTLDQRVEVLALDLVRIRDRVDPIALDPPQETVFPGPDVLELGAGAQPDPRAAVHHDRIVHSDWIDLAHDLTEFPWPWGDGSLDGIIAVDVFEHLRHLDVPEWLDECWRILKPGGILLMRLPAWDNPVSYRDPTHYRVFHQQTFSYWDPDSELYELFGRYYFAESARWWSVRQVFREVGDLRFDLEKLA